MKHTVFQKISAFVTAVCTAFLPFQMLPAAAKAPVYVTGFSVAYGENAFQELEDAGFSPVLNVLNAGVSGEQQVVLGYSLEDGDPITNVVLTPDCGDSFVSAEGWLYECVSHIDLDKGVGDGAGCLYFTRDPRAGEPLVELDIRTTDLNGAEALMPITNDGAEVVRNRSGEPADAESSADNTYMIYLYMIRDHLVRPYIREAAVFTAGTHWDAVYQAARAGYTYYMDGEISHTNDQVTILAYNRTANPDEALTAVAAVTTAMVGTMVEEQRYGGDAPAESTEAATESTEAQRFEVYDPFSLRVHAEDPVTEEAEASEEETAENEPDASATETEETVQDTEEPSAADEEDTQETENEEVTSEAENSEPAGEDPETEQGSVAETEEIPTEEAPTAVSEESTEALEETESQPPVQEHMNGDVISVSGISYQRLTGQTEGWHEGYFLYATRSREAGNPLLALYPDPQHESSECLLGTWINANFTLNTATNAYSHIAGEEALEKLTADMQVCTRIPVRLFSTPGEETAAAIGISMLTTKTGLPEQAMVVNGLLQQDRLTPEIEHDTSVEEKRMNASMFTGASGIALIVIGCCAAAAAVVGAIFYRKRKDRDEHETDTK